MAMTMVWWLLLQEHRRRLRVFSLLPLDSPPPERQPTSHHSPPVTTSSSHGGLRWILHRRLSKATAMAWQFPSDCSSTELSIAVGGRRWHQANGSGNHQWRYRASSVSLSKSLHSQLRVVESSLAWIWIWLFPLFDIQASTLRLELYLVSILYCFHIGNLIDMSSIVHWLCLLFIDWFAVGVGEIFSLYVISHP